MCVGVDLQHWSVILVIELVKGLGDIALTCTIGFFKVLLPIEVNYSSIATQQIERLIAA